MQMVLSSRRTFRRPLALVRTLAGLAMFGVAASGLSSPALPQTPDAVTLSLFDPDLADIRSGGAEKLKDATNCFPSATFIVGAVAGDLGEAPGDVKDDLMRDALGKAREEALHAALTRLGIDGARFKILIEPETSYGVHVYHPTPKSNANKDGPALKVTSEPKKGAKVKAGDSIAVTIEASERYEDGYRGWPTGVQSIQLIADGGPGTPKTLVDSKDFGRIPPPCERRKVVMEPYIVPENPPAIIHLHALVEDAVGNPNSKDADFPTGDWFGTLKVHGVGNIYDDTGTMDFSFSVGPDGAVTGRGNASTTNAPHFLAPCTYTAKHTPSESSVDIGGKLDGDEFKLKLTPRAAVTLQVATDCKGAGKSPAMPVRGMLSALGYGGANASVESPRVRAADGATNTWHQNDGAVEMTGSIELHRAKD